MVIHELTLVKFLQKFKGWKRGSPGSVYFKLAQSRNAKILNSMVGLTFVIYNGKVYIPVKIVKTMVNHSFGAFSFAYAIWVKKKKKKYLGKHK